jgi:subtilisin family serine protease
MSPHRAGLPVVALLAAALGLSACFGAPPPPPPPPAPPPAAVPPPTSPCGAAVEDVASPTPGAPIPPGEAGIEARTAVEESDTRTPTGQIPLVTLEDTPAGSEITVTPVSTGDEAAAVADEAATDGDLIVVEVDTPVQALDHPGDPRRHDQWALDRAKFEDAWPVAAEGAGVTVAVIDTGVKANHEDFAVGQVLPGQEFLNGTSQPGGTTDIHGHGTHVAGIVGAAALNGLGIHGAAPGVAILPVRVLNAAGDGFNSDVANGIEWAVGNGADVINLSLGSSAPSGVLQQKINSALTAGVVVVAAAGNECEKGNPTVYPAALAGVVAVGATNQTDGKPTFSSVGSYVDLAAPGVDVLSTVPTGYKFVSGTSMASPHVAAAAALVKAAHPTFSVNQICTQLLRSGDDLGASGKDAQFGHGLVDPVQAVGPQLAPAASC